MLEKRKTMKTVIVSSAAVAVMLIGAASAYFTSTDENENTWTVGSVEVELLEEAYDAAEPGEITPLQELDKDPVIENTGENDAFVFVKFSIPKADVETAEADGTKNDSEVLELFDYDIDNDWVLVESDETGETANTYVYAYGNETACTSLAPEGKTSSVFDGGKITFINVIEDQVGESLDIPVKIYGIQTTNLNGETTDPQGVWDILFNQTEGEEETA